MPLTCKRDRGALVALGMGLGAIVLVVWLGWLSGKAASTVTFNPWKDSYAQWLMALLSVAATATSIWAVILVRQSLDLNRSATAAATSANEIARKQFLAEHRPWIAIETPEVSIYSDDGQYPIIFFKIKTSNLGKGPALGVEIHVKVEFPKLVVENSKAVEAFVSDIKRAARWAWGNTIIFPENSPLLEGFSEAIDNSSPRNGSARLLICVTYKSGTSEEIFHAARAFRFSAAALNGVGEKGTLVTERINASYIRGSDSIA